MSSAIVKTASTIYIMYIFCVGDLAEITYIVYSLRIRNYFFLPATTTRRGIGRSDRGFKVSLPNFFKSWATYNFASFIIFIVLIVLTFIVNGESVLSKQSMNAKSVIGKSMRRQSSKYMLT